VVARTAGSWLLALAASSPLLAQRGTGAPPTLTLTTPLAEHPEPLTQPGSLHELRDGRILIADTKDRLLYLYDFANQSAAQVSRQGGGPLEYQFPAGIFAAGDSILVVDMLQQRFLVLDAAGTPRRTHRLVATGDVATTMVKLGTVIAIDAKGRVYTESRGVTIVAGKMPTLSDTVALVRWSTLGTRGDTLATRIEHAEMPKMGGTPQSGISFKLPMTAFTVRDAWAVFPDGRVAVARGSDYHTEWIDAGGRRTVAGRVPYTPIPITERDKERARKAMREGAEQGLKLGASMAASSGQKMPKIAMDVEEPASWPKVKPPFAMVRAGPDGRLWVVRSGGGDDEGAEYDVLAPDGRLERRVRTSPRVTLLGFGKGVLYAVRKDEDDLRYLQRYRYP
ncbi:MAG TPA: hypothetical protein VFV33_12470, partial [Gemmatimonadaceae bacterium]|nr:hypothetical protein [Gemmatimonadaceae bacterium]